MQLRRARFAFVCFASASVVSMVSMASMATSQPLARVDVRSSAYVDTDHTVVSTSAVDVAAHATEAWQLRARYLVDVVSSASVDVVASATRRFDMVRNEGTAGASFDDGTHRIDGTYVYSRENDWVSHNANVGGSIDLRDHDITLAISGSYSHNDVGRAHDPNFHRLLTYGGGTARIVLVASPTTLVSIGYEYHHYDGYQASPYRYVRYADPRAQIAVAAPESTPDRRNRHALALRYHHALDPRTFLRFFVRFYGDDWGVVSATTGLEIERAFAHWSIVGLSRAYVQRGAGFFVDGVYPSEQAYMTMDRELSSFVDGSLGTTLRYRSQGARARVRLELRAIGTYYRFWDFYRLPDRTVVVVDLALGVDR